MYYNTIIVYKFKNNKILDISQKNNKTTLFNKQIANRNNYGNKIIKINYFIFKKKEVLLKNNKILDISHKNKKNEPFQ